MNEPIATHTVAEAMVWRNGFANGERAERERIIKLIEDEQVEPSPNNPMANYDSLVIEGIKEQLILLIKGENK